MKKTSITFLVLCLMLLSTSAFAFNWQMYDFGDNIFDHNNNWAPFLYPHNIGELPSPGLFGEGGEKFDIEGFNFATDGNTINLAITNSFGYSAYSTGWNQTYAMGDLFFGFDGNSYQYAIDISEGKLYEVDSYVGIPDKPGTYYDYSAVRTNVGGWEIESGTYLGDVDNVMSFWEDLETDYLEPGNGDTYVWEFAFDASLLGGFGGASSINFHTTMECGNDFFDETYSVVPEPTTLMLLGIGLTGAFLSRKKFV